MDEDDIWLGDRLPTIYDVAQTIFHYSKTLNSSKINLKYKKRLFTDTLWRYGR